MSDTTGAELKTNAGKQKRFTHDDIQDCDAMYKHKTYE